MIDRDPGARPMPHTPGSENPNPDSRLRDVVEERLRDPQRRHLIRSGSGVVALSFMGGAAWLTTGKDVKAALVDANGPAPKTRPTALGFTAVAKSIADTLTVPAGYTARVLLRLGDPIGDNIPEYRNDGNDDAASCARRAGDHHDGMHFFGMSAAGKFSAEVSDRGLLVQNHESITPMFLHPRGPTIRGIGSAALRTEQAQVLKEFLLHGVSIVEIHRAAEGRWSVDRGSRFNRRIHTLTEMVLSGPAAGSVYMVTKYSPAGTRTRGTVSNCANGYTPWGTYLTCEEHWAGYFRRIAAEDDAKRSVKEVASLNRYGVRGAGRQLWSTVTPDTADELYGRWNAMARGGAATDDYRNVANTYGWVVEIDPFAPSSMPRKRTALGRFAHEGAWPAKVEPGRALVWYMGCDGRNEYIYKFVSAARWDPADATAGLTAGDKYLDNGKLYAAKFERDGTGRWLELSHGANGIDASNPSYSFADAADVVINARLAADVAGGTKMDRPEWGAVDPLTGAVYMTLTNNSETARPLAALDAANPRHYADKRADGKAQIGNPNGHIIRWLENGGDPSATSFRWDIFLFGARATAHPDNVNLSALGSDSDFSSPDGLWFSRVTNICWIETDDGAYTDVTNCMLLAALPGVVGDGGARTITSTDASGAVRQVQTFAGAQLGSRLRRFLVGPVACEITGMAESPDGRALFVNIQHPGEDTVPANIGNPEAYTSHWPDGGAARPRSATIVITRDDGGMIGV